MRSANCFINSIAKKSPKQIQRVCDTDAGLGTSSAPVWAAHTVRCLRSSHLISQSLHYVNCKLCPMTLGRATKHLTGSGDMVLAAAVCRRCHHSCGQVFPPLCPGSSPVPPALTHEELTVELQASMPVRGGRPGLAREPIHVKRSFLNVPLCPHIVPPTVVQGRWGPHCDHTRPVPHIKGKGHFCRSWKYRYESCWNYSQGGHGKAPTL